MTGTNPPADRFAEIRARLAAISPTMSVRVADGDSTLIATTARSERLDNLTDGVVGLVESLGDVKVRQTGVTIADDEEGQDLTFLLHAPRDITVLLEENWRLDQLRKLGEAMAVDKIAELNRRVEELEGQLAAVLAVKPLPTRPNATRITKAGAQGHALALADIRRALGYTPDQIGRDLNGEPSDEH
jgi:hypothetical protein